ncbi:MAG TPA: putative 2OG-Fe(II) oxygenase [Steroidobacteraceae bacterium]|nr:putative 2OG-Fe(II) oxygenase [Steroidobacteraceae bacterium]
MVSPRLVVSPGFAVPFAEGRLVPCERLNRELEDLFLARETEEYRNPTPSHIPQAEMFESRFNLFRWPERCIQELRSFMLDSVARAVLETSTLAAEELARLKMHNHTWYHITRYAGSFVAHNHPLASWSAVYCVRSGEAVPAHPGSGLLRFFDTRAGADSYMDAGNRALRAAFAPGARELRLEAGQIVVFPSYVIHEVSPFYGRDTRITVATNCWFS